MPLQDANPTPSFGGFGLRNDDELWEVVRPDLVRVTSAKHAYISDLRKLRIRGGLTQRVLDKLDANPELVRRIVQNLLNAFFPPSLHQDVLWETRLHHFTEISVQSMTKLRRSNRDRSFRLAVLNAYGTRCAVCGFAVRLSNYPVGLEAAHIRWHSAINLPMVQQTSKMDLRCVCCTTGSLMKGYSLYRMTSACLSVLQLDTV